MQGSIGGKVAAILLLGAILGTAAAQPMTRGGRPVGAPHPSELYDQLFGGGKTKTAKQKGSKAKAPAAAPAKSQAAADKPAAEEKPVVEKAADRFEREQRAFLRRLAVCDRLRQIAIQTNDEGLFRQADQLQEQAWSLCLERTGMVPVEDEALPVDEAILDQRLGTESRATRVDRLYTVPGRDAAPRQLAQEDEP